MKRWQDWANLVLGAWMIISPWALRFAKADDVAAMSAWLLGAGILVFSAMATYMPKAWEEGINVVLGVGLIASPWALGFATRSEPTSNATIVGVLVAAIAAWAMLSDPALRDRLGGRHQAR